MKVTKTLFPILIGVLFLMNVSSAEPAGKKSRSLTTDAEIRQMRENIAKYPQAKQTADSIINAADVWASRSDRYIWEMIPSYDIPRAFNSSFDGCPVHGKEYFKYGNYSWKMDPFNKPWKIVCPVGGEEYPSNDFMAYYKTKDKSLLTGPYADDGWGWRKDGDKYKHWFVAYYCHWLWRNYIIPGISNLSRAYQITGDPKYAHKALVMLDRIADFYPSMDHNKQSRYAQEFAPDYQGKIVNYIWETGVITDSAESYDNAFDLIASDGQFATDEKDSPLAGRSNADIRRNIETNLLRDGVQAICGGKIRGNYGMHQRALLTLAIVLQDDTVAKHACDFVLNNSGDKLATEGFNYAMSNLVLREGIAFESSPGYCLGWSGCLSSVGELLDKLGVSIFSDPKFKRMYTAYMELQCMGRFTPNIGDYAGVQGGASNLPAGMARQALEQFKAPVFAAYMLKQGMYGPDSLSDLKLSVLTKKQLQNMGGHAADLTQGCKNLGGYGLGILEAGSGERKVGLSCYYGPTEGGHCHADKLFFEVYGFGRRLIPDLGYPQFAAEYKDRQAWESHNLSHTTVTVDGKRQSVYSRGVLNQFSVSPDVKLLDMSAPDVYSGTVSDYRRVMLLIGGESESPYVVDFFTVAGGRSHDYSLHGFDGQFSTEGIDLKAQEKGTLAGADVSYGYFFDDPDLEKPDKTRSFGSYQGSGYSFLYNVSRGVPSGTWSAVWQDKDSGIRAIFPDRQAQEAVTADGNPPKRPGNPEKLRYVLLRHSGAEGLSSRFVCVLQPFKTGDAPLKVKRLPAESGDLLEITGPHGMDYVYLAEDASKTIHVGGLSITGRTAVLRMAPDGALKSACIAGGGSIRQGMLSIESQPPITGTVSAVNHKTNELELSLSPSLPFPLSSGETILFGESNYPIHTARTDHGKLTIGLGEDTPRIGKLAVESIDPEGRFIKTKSLLVFASSGCYRNRWLVNEDLSAWHRITDVSEGRAMLKEPADLKSEFTDRDGDGHITAYLYDIAPGQEFTIPASCWLGRDSTGKWMLESNSRAKASLPDGTDLW